jgi:hypothetical protein
MDFPLCNPRKRRAAVGSDLALNISPIIRRVGGEGKQNHSAGQSVPVVRKKRLVLLPIDTNYLFGDCIKGRQL